jgi:hypothetical protein
MLSRLTELELAAVGLDWLAVGDAMKTRIMYIERKAGALTGEARIGRVTFNKTGRTIFYREHVFRRIVGGGFKSNYYDEATGEDYWISGPKQRGGDRMYGSALPVPIDKDVRGEYWRDIRREPERKDDEAA